MTAEALMMACVSDVSGMIRGKGFPVASLPARVERGVGWVPTNVQITCFDGIAPSPYGSLGDLVLWPDLKSEVRVDFADGSPVERFVLGDVAHTDGRPWECCLRTMLRRALDALEAETGLSLVATFEHEFMFKGGAPAGAAFSLDGFRRRQRFGEVYLGALRQAGLAPDTFLREFGRDQYEVTIDPAPGLVAADQSLVLRALARATAARMGEEITFTPLIGPAEVGNGVHVHVSFRDGRGFPATYDANGRHRLSQTAGAFVAGILKYLDRIVAFTAPSVVSYARLTPHRWSAAFNNLGDRDREASVRICPTSARDEAGIARQYHFEVRACDAAASPHLQLAALVLAGLAGVREGLDTPTATTEDLSLLDAASLAAKGVARLPTSLAAALDRLAADAEVRGWFPEGFVDIYLAHKRGEIAALEGKDEAAVCAAYAAVY